MPKTRVPLLSLLVATLLTALPAQSEANDAAAKTSPQRIRKEANAAIQAADFPKAADAFRKLTELDPQDGEAWHMLGYSLHAAGKLDEALPIHEKAAAFPASAPAATYNVACVHALRGRSDEAFASLEKAVGLGFTDTDLLASDSDLASLRKDPRFAKVVETAKAKRPSTVAFAQTTERKSARVAWFDQKGSPGQIALDYCPLPWNDEYSALVDSGKLHGKKWRLGADFWTTLDTSIDLQFGAVAVPAGYWYLTLEQRAANEFVLGLHDAATVKKQRLDPVFAARLTGGIEVPLTHERSTTTAERLEITIAPIGGSQTEGTLQLRFGGHTLAAPVSMRIALPAVPAGR